MGRSAINLTGLNGGSGSGAGDFYDNGNTLGGISDPVTSPIQGYAGGTGTSTAAPGEHTVYYASSGGGGAGGAGGNSVSTVSSSAGSGGNGGIGVSSSISGTSVCRAGGGAGSNEGSGSAGTATCGGVLVVDLEQ